MKECFQFNDQSVLEHGLFVNAYYNDLRSHILFDTPLEYEWKLPEWASDPILWKFLLPEEDIKTYQIYHDCGKPFCIEYDNEGRKHFPDHANVSYETWLKISNNKTIANLIKRDMEIHTIKADDCLAFCEDKSMACTLLITGLCELHSNAAMFGGTDSTSFKIKWKHLNKRGKKIINIIKNKQEKSL